jgi:hypothetical protein
VTGDTLILKRLEKSIFYFFFLKNYFLFSIFKNKKQKSVLGTESKTKVSPATHHQKVFKFGGSKNEKKKVFNYDLKTCVYIK